VEGTTLVPGGPDITVGTEEVTLMTGGWLVVGSETVVVPVMAGATGTGLYRTGLAIPTLSGTASLISAGVGTGTGTAAITTATIMPFEGSGVRGFGDRGWMLWEGIVAAGVMCILAL